MSRLKSLDSFVCTYCYNHPVERWWIDRRTIRAGLVSDGECVCLPSTPMIQHGKWKFGTVVPATQTRDQVFYFQWIIQCSQSSDFFSVIITPAFLIFFFRVSYQRKLNKVSVILNYIYTWNIFQNIRLDDLNQNSSVWHGKRDSWYGIDCEISAEMFTDAKWYKYKRTSKLFQ